MKNLHTAFRGRFNSNCEQQNENIYKVLLSIIALAIATPSIIYLLKNKTILNFKEWFTFFLKTPNNYTESIIGAIIFGALLILAIWCYFKLIKNSSKEFKNLKQIIIYVLIICCIFGIMLPFTTSDIFYYIGTGWIDSNYKENPYYTTVEEVRLKNPNDEILQRTGVWENQVVVYGPLWAFICKILATFSFGNATLALYVFKLSNIIVHILNTILVYRITKKGKFTIIYGLNPFILFEMITNVHNDIYLMFFILLSLYFLLKKKNIILTVVFMSLATCIKYVSVLLVPFLVLYYLRNQKLSKKILYCFLYSLLFIVIMLGMYLIYAKDITMFSTMMMQQGKYRESVLAIALEMSYRTGIDMLSYVKSIFVVVFIFVLIDGLIFMFAYKKINFKDTIRKYNNLITAFLFLIITNLCPWYTSWLIPTMFWLRGKQIKNILYLQFSYELVTLINFALYSESYKIGLLYLPIIVILMTVINIVNNKKYMQLKRLRSCNAKKM